MSELTRSAAEEMLSANGFAITKFDPRGCDGVYYFRVWAEHDNGYGVGIMQFRGSDKIDVHIMLNGSMIYPNAEPFNGSAKAYPEPKQLDALLKRIASKEFIPRTYEQEDEDGE